MTNESETASVIDTPHPGWNDAGWTMYYRLNAGCAKLFVRGYHPFYFSVSFGDTCYYRSAPSKEPYTNITKCKLAAEAKARELLQETLKGLTND